MLNWLANDAKISPTSKGIREFWTILSENYLQDYLRDKGYDTIRYEMLF